MLATDLTALSIKLDAVFINAGGAKFAPFGDVNETLWDQSLDTNVKGAYFQLQALLSPPRRFTWPRRSRRSSSTARSSSTVA